MADVPEAQVSTPVATPVKSTEVTPTPGSPMKEYHAKPISEMDEEERKSRSEINVVKVALV